MSRALQMLLGVLNAHFENDSRANTNGQYEEILKELRNTRQVQNSLSAGSNIAAAAWEPFDVPPMAPCSAQLKCVTGVASSIWEPLDDGTLYAHVSRRDWINRSEVNVAACGWEPIAAFSTSALAESCSSVPIVEHSRAEDTFADSTFVMVSGLVARSDLNGKIGVIQTYHVERNRYAVSMLESGYPILLKKANVREATSEEIDSELDAAAAAAEE
jgi:hypothetical protein